MPAEYSQRESGGLITVAGFAHQTARIGRECNCVLELATARPPAGGCLHWERSLRVKNIVAAILAMAFATYAPVAFADWYYWCYIDVGVQTTGAPEKRYYSGLSYGTGSDSAAISNDFRSHFDATYGGSVTGSRCGSAKSRREATNERNDDIATTRDLGATTVTTGWTWRGTG